MKSPIALPTDPTEALLQDLIAEVRLVIHDFALKHWEDAQEHERLAYIRTFTDLIRAGAAVGDTVARLRGGGGAEMRQRITVERVEARPVRTLSTSRGEGG